MAFESSSPEQLELNRARAEAIGRKVRRKLGENNKVQRIATGKAELWAVPAFLDAIDCGRLITMIDATARPSQAYDVEYARGIRTSYSGDVDPKDAFVRTLERRLNGLLGIERIYGETMQGQRYMEGQEFKPHIDWFVPDGIPWKLEWNRGGQRTYTAMIFLNTVEQGGETDFPHLDLAIQPRAGTLLIWNNANEDGTPNSWTMHAGNPVTRGIKYIVTKWYRCQPWRPVNPSVPAPR